MDTAAIGDHLSLIADRIRKLRLTAQSIGQQPPQHLVAAATCADTARTLVDLAFPLTEEILLESACAVLQQADRQLNAAARVLDEET